MKLGKEGGRRYLCVDRRGIYFYFNWYKFKRPFERPRLFHGYVRFIFGPKYFHSGFVSNEDIFNTPVTIKE